MGAFRASIGLVLALTMTGCPGDDATAEGSTNGGTESDSTPTSSADQTADGTAAGGGCQHVDVIIATDNSSTMDEEHAEVAGPVIDALPAQLLAINGGIEDFHLAVIDGCPKPAYFHDTGRSGACEYSTGTNWMSSDSPDLAAEVACVTDFISTGYMDQEDMCLDEGDFIDDDEQAGLAAAEAVSGEAVSGANAGFLRDDALLFVVTLTDEDEQLADVMDPQEIYDRLVAAKGGDASKVVYLGIAGGSECMGPYGEALDAEQARNLAGLFADQGQGMFWDLCMGDLAGAFAAAIEQHVDPACQSFTP